MYMNLVVARIAGGSAYWPRKIAKTNAISDRIACIVYFYEVYATHTGSRSALL